MNHKELLESYIKAHEKLTKRITKISEELLKFKPGPGRWSIYEHIIHIVDSEINNFIRWKSTIAQPGSDIYVIDEETWTENMNYETENLAHYLEVFRLLRLISYDYLQKIDEKRWTEGYFIHKDLGKITLEQIIVHYRDHIDFHLEYIDKIEQEFSASK